jgi:hypothetical protein
MEKQDLLKLSRNEKRWGKRRMEKGGVDLFMVCLIYFKNFCKCHNVSSPSILIKKKKNRLHFPKKRD